MTDKKYVEKMANALDVSRKATEELAVVVSEMKELYTGRTTRVINRIFEISSYPEEAVELILSMGYSKDEIRESGHKI